MSSPIEMTHGQAFALVHHLTEQERKGVSIEPAMVEMLKLLRVYLAKELGIEAPPTCVYRDASRGLELASGIKDMIDGGRLTEGDIPDDWQWLSAKLEEFSSQEESE